MLAAELTVIFWFKKHFVLLLELRYDWTPAKMACTVGENIRSFNGISTIKKCQEKCEAESGCKSVDYNPISFSCYLNSGDESSTAYRNPCPVREEQFSEIKTAN